jgi:capsular polysaccharide biosynthesis protein
LYLDRGDRRRSARAPEYRARAERAGFRAWSPETVSFADQVAIWSRIEAVTGESGAAWSGVLFAPEGSRGLVVNDGTASGWPHLSRISGMETRVIRPMDVEDFACSLRDLLGA